jgi:hypothetical protein
MIFRLGIRNKWELSPIQEEVHGFFMSLSFLVLDFRFHYSLTFGDWEISESGDPGQARRGMISIPGRTKWEPLPIQQEDQVQQKLVVANRI